MIRISVLMQDHAGPTGRVLLGKNENGVWEFPHGYRRVNETAAEAVERICFEVLGVRAVAGKLIVEGHKYPEGGTSEHFLCGNFTHNTRTKCDYHNYYEAVDKWSTEPESKVYTDFKWVHPSQLGAETYAGDDAAFMKKYDPYVNPDPIPDVRMF